MPPLQAAYWLALLAEIAVRLPYDRRRKRLQMVDRRVTAAEIAVLLALLLGMLLLPLVYSATSWLAFADYDLPPWAGGLGIALIAGAVAVFWRAHADLGANWSPTLEVRAGHELVTQGIYGQVRHPMYASQALWVIAQPLLLQNWLAGWLHLVLFVVFYALRVPAEERMLRQHFGAAYDAYAARVGGVLPRFGATP